MIIITKSKKDWLPHLTLSFNAGLFIAVLLGVGVLAGIYENSITGEAPRERERRASTPAPRPQDVPSPNQCTPENAVQCSPNNNNIVQKCSRLGARLTWKDTTQNCAVQGQFCSGGQCRSCSPDQRRCAGTGNNYIQKCTDNGFWEGEPNFERCQHGCVGGECNMCSAEDAGRGQYCSPNNNAVLQCATTVTGLRELRQIRECLSGETCENAQCVQVCNSASEPTCQSTNTVKYCENGRWREETCQHRCMGGRCSICTPGERECTGQGNSYTRTCTDTGVWSTNQPTRCEFGCVLGMCHECSGGTPIGVQRCIENAESGDVIESCRAISITLPSGGTLEWNKKETVDMCGSNGCNIGSGYCNDCTSTLMKKCTAFEGTSAYQKCEIDTVGAFSWSMPILCADNTRCTQTTDYDAACSCTGQNRCLSLISGSAREGCSGNTWSRNDCNGDTPLCAGGQCKYCATSEKTCWATNVFYQCYNGYWGGASCTTGRCTQLSTIIGQRNAECRAECTAGQKRCITGTTNKYNECNNGRWDTTQKTCLGSQQCITDAQGTGNCVCNLAATYNTCDVSKTKVINIDACGGSERVVRDCTVDGMMCGWGNSYSQATCVTKPLVS